MEPKATPRPGLEESQAPLPAERGFVVQFRAQADPSRELFVGRAEHIASGTAVRFASFEELITFITSVLAAPAPSPAEPSASKTEGEESA